MFARFVPCAAPVLALVTLHPAPGAQTERLNAHFEYEAVVGDVYDFELKPGGSFLFFRADERRAGTVELFAASTEGTTALRRENRMLLPERSVTDFQPGPVGNWIVFVADQDADEVFELYSRRFSDTAPRKLNGPLPPGGDVTNFAITPDGTRVVYLANQDSSNAFELYSVPIDGSAGPVKLSGALADGGSVSSFGVSPTSDRVVFRGYKDDLARLELYSAPVDGSATPVKLNLPLPPTFDVSFGLSPAITSDGATVVFLAQLDLSNFGLYRVPIDGSSPAVLIADGAGEYALGSDDQRVVYTGVTLPGVADIYSAPLDGSQAPVLLHPAFPNNGGVVEFRVAPDAGRVAFVASVGFDPHGHTSYELFSAPIDGSGPALTLDVPPDSRAFQDLGISSDSGRAIYVVRKNDFSDYDSLELRSVPLDGSVGAVRLDSPSGAPARNSYNFAFAGPVPFRISADAQRVIFLWHPANTSSDDEASRGLFSAPIDGSAPPITLAGNGVSYSIATSVVGARAYFIAALAGDDVHELYGVTLEGTDLVKLNGKLARDTGADVAALQPGGKAFALFDGGERVLHSADATTDQVFELFSGRVDGGTRATALRTGTVTGPFRVSPDGTRVVYFDGDLHSVPTDASSNPVKLLDGASAGELILDDFEVSPDSTKVVFRSSVLSPGVGLLTIPIAGGTPHLIAQRGLGLQRFALSASTGRAVYLGTIPPGTERFLFSVPIDGSAAPIQLDPVASSSLEFRLSPDGTRVAYSSGQGIAVVPVNGSAGPTLLSGTLVASSPRFSPDGQWVVFAGATTLQPGVLELYSARSNGSLGPLKLNAPFVAGGDLATGSEGAAFSISPDSTRVVYVADQEVDERFELYAVNIDQSSIPRKLNGPLPSGGDVVVGAPGFDHVRISPDGSRVVYAADQEVDERLELYSVPLATVGSPVKLNGVLVLGGDIATGSGAPFVISPDSRFVVYRADQVTDGLFDLFLVPIDRSLEPLGLTGGLARPGASYPEITSDSRRVVYQATERSQVTELFSTVLTFDPHRQHLGNGGAERP